jgi:hypothetical protein
MPGATAAHGRANVAGARMRGSDGGGQCGAPPGAHTNAPDKVYFSFGAPVPIGIVALGRQGKWLAMVVDLRGTPCPESGGFRVRLSGGDMRTRTTRNIYWHVAAMGPGIPADIAITLVAMGRARRRSLAHCFSFVDACGVHTSRSKP